MTRNPFQGLQLPQPLSPKAREREWDTSEALRLDYSYDDLRMVFQRAFGQSRRTEATIRREWLPVLEQAITLFTGKAPRIVYESANGFVVVRRHLLPV